MPETATGPRILVVTDLSEEADLAITEAARHAAARGGDLCVVHAVPHLDAIRPLFPQRLADETLIAAELPRRAEDTLRARLATLNVDAGKVEIAIERGTTVEGALLAIERWHPTLVVIGAGEGAVDAVRLVRHVTCPILVARPGPATGPVVAGTDLSDPSLPAIRAALEASAHDKSEVVVAHVIELNPLSFYGVAMPPMLNATTPEALHDAARARLDRALEDLGGTARTAIRVGPPSVVLPALAKTEQASLLARPHGAHAVRAGERGRDRDPAGAVLGAGGAGHLTRGGAVACGGAGGSAVTLVG